MTMADTSTAAVFEHARDITGGGCVVHCVMVRTSSFGGRVDLEAYKRFEPGGRHDTTGAVEMTPEVARLVGIALIVAAEEMEACD